MGKRVCLFIMQKRGLAVLEALLHDRRVGSPAIEYVVSARDANVAGDYYEQIKALCKAENVQFYDRKEQTSTVSELSLAIGWRWLIAKVNKLIVIHDSLLPKFRGFAPVVASLIAGEEVLGATAFFASERYDEGPIVAQESVTIAYPIKVEEALTALVPVFQTLATKVVSEFLNGQLSEGVAQEDSEASYSLWRDKDDYFVDWSRDSAYIKRFVDAVGYPFAAAQSSLNARFVKIVECELYPELDVSDRGSHIGKTIFIESGQPVVICGQGLVRITAMTDMEGVSLLPLVKIRSRFA